MGSANSPESMDLSVPRKRTAKEVGDEFVGKYYQTLQNSPNDLREFYDDISTIIRPRKDGTMCAYTLSDIGENLNTLYSSGFDSVKVTTISSTHSQVGRVYVVVDGYFTLNEEPEKNFTQILSLAPQENNYIVMLDIFEFVHKPKEEEDSKASVPEEEDSKTKFVFLTRGPADLVGRSFAEQYYNVLQNHPDRLHLFYKGYSKIERPGNNGVMCSSTISNLDENFNMLSSGGFDSAEVTRVVSLESFREGVNVVVEGYFRRNFLQHFFIAPQATGYFVCTDMFRFAHNPENFEPGLPEAKDGNVVSVENSNPEAKDENVVSVKKSNPEAKDENVVSVENSKSSVPQDWPITEGSAICVRKLPRNATITMLEDVFRQFGEIKSGQTVVRHKPLFSYGFVEFMEANAAQKAIEASHVMVGGQKVWVLKKQSPEEQAKILVMKQQEEQAKILVMKQQEEQAKILEMKQQEEEGKSPLQEVQRKLQEEQRTLQEEQRKLLNEQRKLLNEQRKTLDEQRKLQKQQEES